MCVCPAVCALVPFGTQTEAKWSDTHSPHCGLVFCVFRHSHTDSSSRLRFVMVQTAVYLDLYNHHFTRCSHRNYKIGHERLFAKMDTAKVVSKI
jgi:hypothetical protein